MDVSGIVGAVAVVAGALLGAWLTQSGQRKNIAAAQLLESRIECYSQFASAIQEYRKAKLDRWHRQREGMMNLALADAVYSTAAVAAAALHRVSLLTDDQSIVEQARAAKHIIDGISLEEPGDSLRHAAVASTEAIAEFVRLAGREVRGG